MPVRKSFLSHVGRAADLDDRAAWLNDRNDAVSLDVLALDDGVTGLDERDDRIPLVVHGLALDDGITSLDEGHDRIPLVVDAVIVLPLAAIAGSLID